MGRHGPTDCIHWIVGLDLAGVGALMESDDTLTAQKTDATPIGRTGTVKRSAPLGTIDYAVTEKGWLDLKQLSLRDLLKVGAPEYPWPSIFGYAGGKVGAPVRIATDLRLGTYEVVTATDDLTKVAIEYFNATHSRVVRGHLLAEGVVEGVVDVGLAPAEQYRLDHGEATVNGAILALMVGVQESRWRGYPRLTLQLRHSNNPGSNYVNAGAAWVIDRSSKGATVIDIPGEIRRHTALRFQFSGARDAFATVGAHNAGETGVRVDGATGDERIESGDMLSIAGTDYTVAGARPRGGGEWDVDLTSGLVAATPDNTAVTQTGDHVSLRYAAALHRIASAGPVDNDPPAYLRGSVNRDRLTLTYNENLDEASVPAIAAYTVTVAGAARAVTAVAVHGPDVILTLDSAAAYGEAVTAAYAVPAVAPVRDRAGNNAPGLAARAVVNDTPAPPPRYWAGVSPDAAFDPAEFTVSDSNRQLVLPAYPGAQYIAFALPPAVGDPTDVYLYQAAHRNNVSQLAAFERVGEIELDGSTHNWWRSKGALNGYGSYILEVAV